MLNVAVVDIAVGVEIGEGLQTFFSEAVARKPTGSLGEEERHGEQDESDAHLHEVWTLPGDIAGQCEVKSVVYPARQRVSSDQERVFDADHETTAMRRSDFGLDDGDGHGQEANRETLDCAAGDEAGEIGGKPLDEGADEVEEGTDADALLPADDVS